MATCKPKISVVIPAYNRERTIARSIESVLSQSYQDFEIIVVDDCSQDNTKHIVSNMRSDRIRYIRLPENRGAGAARNAGAKAARGEYIAFQDSDDVWRPDKLEIQVHQTLQNKAAISIGRMSRNGYSADEAKIIPPLEQSAGLVARADILKGNIVGMPTLLIKTDAMLEEPFDESLRYCEDAEWSFRISSKYDFLLIDDVLVDVYLRKDSVTVVNQSFQRNYYEKILTYDQSTFDLVPDLQIMALEGLAKCKQLDGKSKEAKDLLKRALLLCPSARIRFKLLLADLKLLGLFYKLKG